MTRRHALLAAVLPPLAGRDLRDFDARLDAAAPLHLRAALVLASVLLVEVAPRLCGHLRSLRALPPPAREAVVRRVAGWPGFADLLEIGKLVACFAWYDDDAVEARAREAR